MMQRAPAAVHVQTAGERRGAGVWSIADPLANPTLCRWATAPRQSSSWPASCCASARRLWRRACTRRRDAGPRPCARSRWQLCEAAGWRVGRATSRLAWLLMSWHSLAQRMVVREPSRGSSLAPTAPACMWLLVSIKAARGNRSVLAPGARPA